MLMRLAACFHRFSGLKYLEGILRSSKPRRCNCGDADGSQTEVLRTSPRGRVTILSYFAACPGSIPKELGALGKLETMFVNDNALEGEDFKESQVLPASFFGYTVVCAISTPSHVMFSGYGELSGSYERAESAVNDGSDEAMSQRFKHIAACLRRHYPC